MKLALEKLSSSSQCGHTLLEGGLLPENPLLHLQCLLCPSFPTNLA